MDLQQQQRPHPAPASGRLPCPWLLFVGLALLPSCEPPPEPCAGRIYVSFPISLQAGQEMLQAAEMALGEWGGMAGECAVELEPVDSVDLSLHPPMSSQKEEDGAQQAARDPETFGYLGPPSSDMARVSLPILNRAEVVQISSAATWPGLTRPGFGPGEPGIYYPTGRRHFFRTVPTDDEQGKIAARWAYRLGFRKVYVVDDGLAYGRGIGGIFTIAGLDLGIEVVGSSTLGGSTAAEDQRAAGVERHQGRIQEIMEDITRTEPDLVFLACAAVTGGLESLTALRQRFPDLAVMGAESMAQRDLLAAPDVDLFDGLYTVVLAFPDPEVPASAGFAAQFEARYGISPGSDATATYASTQLLLEAIAAAGPDRAAILRHVEEMETRTDVLGTWTFDENGDITPARLTGIQLQQGRWTVLERLQ